MAVSRANFAATLLANGRVLVAGGTTDPRAELFDPATRTFSLTGSMITGRGLATTTLLRNGKVLIAGGHDSSGIATASAELYDPSTGAFSTTGSMTIARAAHTATLLASGKVLIAGGHVFNRENSALASAELYDPSTGAFGPTGAMAVARDSAVAALLANGKVLIAGGYTTSSIASSSAEIYDPAAGKFSMTGALASGRGNATATPISTGDVLVAGGFTAFPGGALQTAELYSPASGTFNQTGSMSTPRGDQTATLLPNGTVLVVGGFTAFPFLGATLASTELYDPIAGTFTPSGSLTVARGRHAAVALANGDVLVAGGLTQCCSTNSSAELLISGDTTPPTLTVPEDISINATSPGGAVVTYNVTAMDDTDPNPTVTCAPQSGSVFAIGATTVNCTATDASGNQATASFTVYVKGAQEQLQDLLHFVDSQKLGTGTSLHDKLVRALTLLQQGDVAGTCDTLNAFVSSVRAQTGKSLTAEQAARLTTDALRIENVIGC